MIEIIREEEMNGTTERRALPKDIKQMGEPDIGDRIYIENEVYQFLHPYSNIEERRAYVLLGHFDNYSGKNCVFVEAAIYLEELLFDGDLPVWNDNTWSYIYKQLRREYDKMVIVGWAMDIKGMLPNMTLWIEQLHQNNFGGEHQILFMMDSLEHEEAFYSSKSGHMYRREGFYVYYDRTLSSTQSLKRESQEVEMISKEKEESRKEDGAFWGDMEAVFRERDSVGQRGTYRRQSETREPARLVPSYVTTMVLVVLVGMLGVTAYSNNQKMVAMQETLAQMGQVKDVEQLDSVGDVTADTTTVMVETVSGNVQKQEEMNVMQSTTNATQMTNSTETTQSEGEQPDMSSQNADAVENTSVTEVSTEQATETMTEAQTYLKQGYYIVQKGDSLAGICRKVYQTTAMMDKLCEVNEIENEDAIYAGQKLVLPN